MKYSFLPLAVALVIFSCKEQNNNQEARLITINKSWLDSIIKASDSSYTKPYKRTDFVYADFYTNIKDSSVCQVMKDSAGNIRQVLIARNNIRTFFAQYYTNGQLQADLRMDEFGQYNDSATYYFQSGQIESTGNYSHGIKTGQWKNFNEKGKLVSTDHYDDNGQVIK